MEGTSSPEENAMLHAWYDTIDPDMTETVLVDSPTSSAEIGNEIFTGLQERIAQEKGKAPELPRRTLQWRYAAAVVLLFLSGIAIYQVLSSRTQKDQPTNAVASAGEIHAPQSARALITLTNGTKLYLDSIPDGTVAIEGKTRVVKQADGLIYESFADRQEVSYNVLTVPRGSRIVHVTLSDGARVWLNAESSMRYPVAFTGTARNVEITGEAYFEVGKDPHRPFYVTSRGLTTEVLGTHFNVNTYADERAMKVSLLEGSVRVRDGQGNAAMLKPGEQANVKGAGANGAGVSGPSNIQVEKNIDMEAVIAWKNEYFMMKDVDLGMLARQMARWYDIEIVFEGKIPDKKFGGSINRNVNLSTLLKALKESGIQSRFEGKKVIMTCLSQQYELSPVRGQTMGIDPQMGGRITYLRIDGVNFLTDSVVNGENWGSTFWPSPQSDWHWPPPAEWDNKPYAVKENGGGKLEGDKIKMESPADPKTGLVVTKIFSADDKKGFYNLEYVITNRSDAVRKVAPWEVTRVHPNGFSFFPMGKDTLRGGLIPQTRIEDGICWYTYDQVKIPDHGDTQIYTDGSEGWFAAVNGDVVLIKKFPDIPFDAAAPKEGEVELYANRAAPEKSYVEIEHQGAYTELRPGQSFSWTMRWYVRRLPKGIKPFPGNPKLIEYVRKMIKI